MAMDQQHKRMFKLINIYYEAFDTDEEDKIIIKILDEVLNYTNLHFEGEEQLMERHNFPHITSHIKLHQKLVNQVLDMRKRLQVDNEKVFVDLAILLRDWWQDHIANEDKKYGEYINSKGVA